MNCACVIVNYSDSARVVSLAKRLSEYHLFSSIVVSDNCSPIDQIEKLKELEGIDGIKLLFNSENKWFSGGNNEALRYLRNADIQYVCLINSDIEVDKETLTKLIEFLDSHPEIAVSTCQMYEGGEAMQCYYDFPTVRHFICECLGFTKLFKMRPKHYTDYGTYGLVDYARSSLWMVRFQDFSEVDFFDEKTKLYHVETCVGLKLRSIGKEFALLKDLSYQHNHIYTKGYKLRGYKDSYISLKYIFHTYLKKNKFQFFAMAAAYRLGIVIRKCLRVF